MLAACWFHELPDGRVEVGLDVAAFPDKIEIVYQVGISDGSMRSLLAPESLDWESERLLDAYRQKALATIGEHLLVRINGQEQTVKPLRSELGPRHPVRFICYYEVDLPELNQPPAALELEICDQNYADFEKDFRCALRGKDGAEVIESSVAALLVRAQPHKLWELPAVERAARQTIRAKISLTGPLSEDTRSKTRQRSRSARHLVRALAVFAAIMVLLLAWNKLRRRS